MNEYIVYILKSETSGRFYIGCTSDLMKRIKSHNAGKTKSTKPFRPWTVIYSERFKRKEDAYKREWFLKHPKGYATKKAIIENFGGVA